MPSSRSAGFSSLAWSKPVKYLESQVAQDHRPLYPKVAHYGDEVAHNYWQLAFLVDCNVAIEG